MWNGCRARVRRSRSMGTSASMRLEDSISSMPTPCDRRARGGFIRHFSCFRLRPRGEGLFDPERKRPLPAFPIRIGVVTSPTGAALQDVVHVLRRRFPLVEVVLASTPVQGDEAPQGII